MTERELRELLGANAPGEAEAAERSWEVVRAALDACEPLPRERRRPSALVLAFAAALAVAVAAVTPPGRAVLGELRDAVGRERVVGVERAKPALVSLPAPGRLLVVSRKGPWVVQRDGSKRLLGAYDDATWSPRGLFVAAARGRTLVALDPKGEVRWSLSRPGRVSDPRWAPSGFRIAYRSGDTLRVVAGDGTGDRLLARTAGPAAPAWRPGSAHVLAYTDRRGRIRVVDVESGRELWRTPAGPAVRRLEWSEDGRRLLTLAPTLIRVFDGSGRPAGAESAVRTTRERFLGAAFAPAGHRYAATILSLTSRRTSVVLYSEGKLAALGLFEGAGRLGDLAWSPDGRWLLVAWPAADQLIFIRVADRKVLAVSNVAREFDPGGIGPVPFPRIAGWCCAPSR